MDDELITLDGRKFCIVNGIPRFVPRENYANAFGEQWNRFPKTQLDSHTGLPLSENRLARCMRGRLTQISGKRVLEAGSGAGRFTEILLKYGAVVDSFDYSNAVEANAVNNGTSVHLTLAQADIRKPPFPHESYDFVVCLGVIQHTPNPEESIRSLWRMLKPGGALIIDHYRWKLRNFLPPPVGVGGNAYRHYFLRLPKDRQFAAVKRVFDFWFPLIWRFRKSRIFQTLVARLNPIVNYYPHFGLRDRDMYYEWMLLDTHDAMTDVYKHRRTPSSVQSTLQTLGATNIIVSTGGNGVEAYCEKPAARTATS
ncbi:class I SAM-dependent methyltransferase [Rudaea cellulosilytica]|uniref:class I SAM-dependent methyltransferase n=1 Tax=Rudaea cellulosilytica TaxID=540746 RepID=UPI000A062803|nr:class I SAM-dependent methyltransferase [Rudaea cellulosilytica]